MSPFNLSSPTAISSRCDLKHLESWLEQELRVIDSDAVRSVVGVVCTNLTSFVQMPVSSILLWKGADRIPTQGKRQKYHKYPDEIKCLAKERGLKLDTRPNGPAIASFLFAGGHRPSRSGSSNDWSIHHLYSGKYPYLDRTSTTHATKDGLHFTQSAGLVAVHPIADAMCDEFPSFTWFLRAKAFLQYGYDPDQVFTDIHDEYGFGNKSSCKVVFDG